VTLVEESASQPLTPGQWQGFFTSVSSNDISNAIIWAVQRPANNKPGDVTLFAFDPHVAAEGNNSWLFSAPAGTWPHIAAGPNIVPVVANGRVYVASYKQLAIFGLPGAAAIPPVAILRPQLTPMELPAGEHEIFATIKTVAGANITLVTRTGKMLHVDAAAAIAAKQSVVLLVDEAVRVLGSYDSAGALRATSIAHANSTPKGWPDDR
jgi:hypothetical protein